MPIIKDKYKAKSGRTTPIIQRNLKANPVQSNIDGSSIQLSTEQKQALETKKSRENINTIGAGSTNATSSNPNVLNGKISGYRLTNIDSIENVFTLNSNEKLSNIIINYQHSSSTSTNATLFWSLYPSGELENEVSGGRITSSDGKLFRIISADFPSNSTLSLYETCQGFENINKTIYFYALTSVVDSNGIIFTFLVG